MAPAPGRPRAVFFGTPAIAVPSLVALTEIADVVAVVCQPDKPAGRGLELKPPPVKEKALELGLSVHQPTKVRVPEFAAWLASLEADFALVIAYGRILPLGVLGAPKKGCLNLHASILPKWRGAAPITWALAAGDTKTGVSLMHMDEGMDTGPVFAVREIEIGPDTNAAELADRLAACAAEVTRLDVLRAVGGELVARPQEHAAATMARILEKKDGLVDFSRSAKAVHDHVRAMTPWPGAFAYVATPAGPKLIKLLETRLAEGAADAAPGTVVVAKKDRLEIACGDGRVALLRGQLEGKKPLAAADLVAGRALALGALLGAEPAP
jgi:methionyl-tRNA formyltransferase